MARKRKQYLPSGIERLQKLSCNMIDLLEKRILQVDHTAETKSAVDSYTELVFGRKFSVFELFMEVAEIIIKLESIVEAQKKKNDGFIDHVDIPIPIAAEDKQLVEEFVSRQKLLLQTVTAANS